MEAISRAEKFQYWLAEMDEAIERFVCSAPPDVRQQLDGSDESLGAVERWLLVRYSGPQATRATTESEFLDGAARYVGEVLRNRTNSVWQIELQETKDAFYGIPTLNKGSLKAPLCPLTTVKACTDRRSGSYLATILRNVRIQ